MDIGGSMSVLLDKGGFAAYLILFCGFVMAVIGLERLMSLFFRYSFNTEAALEGVRAQVLERKYTQALQVCNGKPNAPDLSVVKAGLIAVETGREPQSRGPVAVSRADRKRLDAARPHGHDLRFDQDVRRDREG